MAKLNLHHYTSLQYHMIRNHNNMPIVYLLYYIIFDTVRKQCGWHIILLQSKVEEHFLLNFPYLQCFRGYFTEPHIKYCVFQFRISLA